MRLRRGDEVLVPDLEVATSTLARSRGLLGRAGLAHDAGLWIDPCPSIHTHFMRFAIDAVFLDRDLRVVRVAHDVVPWRARRGGRGARSVVELPAGAAARLCVVEGDELMVDD